MEAGAATFQLGGLNRGRVVGFTSWELEIPVAKIEIAARSTVRFESGGYIDCGGCIWGSGCIVRGGCSVVGGGCLHEQGEEGEEGGFD